MTTDSSTPIDAAFASWYSAITVGDQQRVVALRHAGMTHFISTMARGDIESLIRLIYSSHQQPLLAVVRRFREAFTRADASFPSDGNDVEVSLLAATTLATTMTAGNDLGIVTALGISTTFSNGYRSTQIQVPLSEIAEATLSRLGIERRRRPPALDDSPTRVQALDFSKSTAAVKASFTDTGVSEGFVQAAAATQRALKQLADRQAQTDLFARIRDEEIQALWWLTGRQSLRFHCSFDELPLEARPLILAKELADMTAFLPGFPAIRGLLSRAGLTEATMLTIPKAVDSSDFAWLTALHTDANNSPVQTPVHYAIAKCLETNRTDTWAQTWSAATVIPIDAAYSELQLAELMYRECLLVRQE